jgi:hypothetical protein
MTHLSILPRPRLCLPLLAGLTFLLLAVWPAAADDLKVVDVEGQPLAADGRHRCPGDLRDGGPEGV